MFKWMCLLLPILFSSCEKTNSDELIPSYIQIDTISLQANYSSQGTSSSKITDAWVYVDDELIGAFELPAKFPVLKEGSHKLTIRSGIKMNGIASTRIYYPMYASLVQTVNLEKEKTTRFKQVSTTYDDNTIFYWKEAFEDGGISLESTDSSYVDLSKTSDALKVFEGFYSGIVNLDAEHDFFEVKTSEAYELAKGGTPVFLELNYKSNNSFIVGLLSNFSGYTVQTSAMLIYPSEKWNKIYVNLTTIINENSLASNYNVYVGAVLDEDVEQAEILFDNFKLVSR